MFASSVQLLCACPLPTLNPLACTSVLEAQVSIRAFFTCRTSKLLPEIYSSGSFFISDDYTKAFSSSWLHFLLTEWVLDVAVTFDADDARQCLEAQLQQRYFVSISAEEENSLDLTTYSHCTSASHWRCKKTEKNTVINWMNGKQLTFPSCLHFHSYFFFPCFFPNSSFLAVIFPLLQLSGALLPEIWY